MRALRSPLIMKLFSALLLALYFMEIYSAEEFVITRNSRDKFKLPPHLCPSNNWKQECSKRNAISSRTRQCICICNKDSTQTVFGFFHNAWKCAKNQDVRTDLGCSDRLSGRTAGKPLLVAAKTKSVRSIGTLTDNKAYSCYLESTFWFMDCKSNWSKVSEGPDVGFSNDYSISSSTFKLYDKGSMAFESYNQTIKGHLIALSVNCYDGSKYDRYYCLLLKVKGILKCPYPLPTTSKPATTLTTTAAESTTTDTSSSTSSRYPTTTLTSTAAHETTQLPSSASSLTFQSTTSDVSNTLPKSQRSTKKEITVVTTQGFKNNLNATKNPLKREDDNVTSKSGTIAGAVGGVAALLAILLILIFLGIRRKRMTMAASDRVAENVAYDGGGDRTLEITGQSAFADDEYSYAYTNNHPIAIKDQNGKALKGVGDSIGQSGNTKVAPGSPPNYDAPVYNTLEDPDYAKLSKSQDMSNEPSYNVLQRRENEWKTKQGPVYDVLEDPSDATQNSEGPIYNTLEDPDYAKLEKAKNTHSDPSYNVLERPESKWPTKHGPVYDEVPDSTGAPVYDVLEGPESDDQHVYGSLENQDPHIYGALNSPTSASGVAFSGYEDVLYDSTGDVIQSGDIYQELNQAGQQSSDDLYQPLRHPRKSMVMKDMSGVTQSHA